MLSVAVEALSATHQTVLPDNSMWVPTDTAERKKKHDKLNDQRDYKKKEGEIHRKEI